ncbi:hypothetical protein R83H12_00780 [Fibrobacteria bacterium R8-3-H12]
MGEAYGKGWKVGLRWGAFFGLIIGAVACGANGAINGAIICGLFAIVVPFLLTKFHFWLKKIIIGTIVCIAIVLAVRYFF